MIKIENVDVHNITRAIYSARNAMNSWDKSDSRFETDTMGENDLKLAKQLVKAGADHSKFMRMITVTLDIIAPLYWWKEFDTYKVGTVRNSCSTMHCIHKKEFTLDDFSHEHLMYDSQLVMQKIIDTLNYWRDIYLNGGQATADEIGTAVYVFKPKNKNVWWQIIQLLPSNYNQRSTVQLNYAVLRNIYHSRKAHKLDEWRDFCEWIEELPYSELITEEQA